MKLQIDHATYIEYAKKLVQGFHPDKEFEQCNLFKTAPIPDLVSTDLEICVEVGALSENNRINELFKFYRIIYWFPYPQVEYPNIIPMFSVWKFIRQDQVLEDREKNKDLINPTAILMAEKEKRLREILETIGDKYATQELQM